MLTDHDLEILTPMPRHERASTLLTGRLGPLAAIPSEPPVAAVAYVIYLAWIRARVPGHMLAGRPGFEAADTMRSRVLAAGRRSGSLEQFGIELFRRLRLSMIGLPTADALWWRAARVAHGDHWRHLSTESVLTDALQAVRLLDDLLRLVPAVGTEATTTDPTTVEPAEAQ